MFLKSIRRIILKSIDKLNSALDALDTAIDGLPGSTSVGTSDAEIDAATARVEALTEKLSTLTIPTVPGPVVELPTIETVSDNKARAF